MKLREERGYVLVTVAMAMVALLGFVALAVDVGFLYSKRTNYQRAADAAALAGAFTYVVEPVSPQPATAQAHATATATNNPAMGTAITPGQVTVTVTTSAGGSHLVTAQIAASSPTFFAKILGINTQAINVTATAEVASTPTAASCVKPWFIPNTILATMPPPGPNLDPCVACTNQNAATSTLLVAGSSGSFQMTNYTRSKLGTQLQIKPQSPANTLAPSQFFAIQMPGSVGANDYRNNIATCVTATVGCTNRYSVETGNMVGPTAQGVNDLIGSSPDAYLSVGQYQLFSGVVSDTSHQLVLAPIWDTCNSNGSIPGTPNFCPAEDFPSGTIPQVGVLGFAMLFIEGIQGNAVVARVVNVLGCGSLNEQGQAPFALPVRLVRP